MKDKERTINPSERQGGEEKRRKERGLLFKVLRLAHRLCELADATSEMVATETEYDISLD